MVIFDILRYSFSSMFWGLLIAVICMALFVFLIKGWYKDAMFSPISYAIGAILFILLTFQCILITGSLKIISSADYYEVQLDRMVESRPSSEEVSMREADDVIKQMIDEYPLLEYYISGGEFSGFTAKELPHAITEELRSFMRWYIFRRILWCLGFVVVAAVLTIKSMSKQYQSRRTMKTRPSRDMRRVIRRPRR